ncbi:DUF2637 domain-containing protein [Micrococcus sp. 2A]|uniref:DUF2637 domain-containing protein n=1 Tax=Micrococcus sp. 2A TaxID=3142261 RepID=UPI0031BB89D8
MSAEQSTWLHEVVEDTGHGEAPTTGQEIGAVANTPVETMHLARSSERGQNSTTILEESAPALGLPRRVNPNDGRFIRAVVIGTSIAGLVAFSISFAALYEVAAWLGLPPFMHWAVPVFIDLAILTYAGSVLVHESRGEPARASWWALGAFTGLSVVANGAHAWSAENATVWQSVVGVLIAAMVPVAVFVATDQLARVAVENPASRRAERAAEMDEEAEVLRAQAELAARREELEAEREARRVERARERRQAEFEAELEHARHRRELEAVAREAEQVQEPVQEDEGTPSSPVVSVRALEPVKAVEDEPAAPVKAPSGAEVTAWIVAGCEAGECPSAVEVAEWAGCSERTGRRRLADVRADRPELFTDEEEQV